MSRSPTRRGEAAPAVGVAVAAETGVAVAAAVGAVAVMPASSRTVCQAPSMSHTSPYFLFGINESSAIR